MPGAWDRVGAAVAWPLANSLVTVLRHPALWFSLSGAFAAYLCALYSFGAPPLPLIYPDSTTYWRAHSIVPLGYPAVIHVLYGATGTLKSIIVFQIAAFGASVLTLQAGVNALTRNAPLAGILALLLLGYHGLAFNSLVMLTEALFTAVLLLHVASAAFAMARDSKIGLVGMAFTAVNRREPAPVRLFPVRRNYPACPWMERPARARGAMGDCAAHSLHGDFRDDRARRARNCDAGLYRDRGLSLRRISV